MTFQRSSELRPNYTNNGRHIPGVDFVDLAYGQWDGLDDKIRSININLKYPPATMTAAVGDDTTDDTNAIQNIINSATLSYDRSVIKGSMDRYKITSPITVNPNEISLQNMWLRNYGTGSTLNITDSSNYELCETILSFDRILISGNNTNTGISLGGSPTEWAGALFSLQNFKLTNLSYGVIFNNNSYMNVFENGAVSYIQGVAFDFPTGLGNAGEEIVLNNVRFYNNPGTLIRNLGGFGSTIILNNCSLDYSGIAVICKDYSRVILNNCHIETDATNLSSDAYFYVENYGALTLNDCRIHFSGDWSSKDFIKNTGGIVKINGGSVSVVGTMPDRLIFDTGTGIYIGMSEVKGLDILSKSALIQLGVSQSLIPNGSFEKVLTSFMSLSYAPNMTIDTGVWYSGSRSLKLTADPNSAITMSMSIPCSPGKTIVPSAVYSTNGITGVASYNAFYGIMIYQDNKGNELSRYYITPFVKGTTIWKNNFKDAVPLYFAPQNYIAPPGATQVILSYILDHITAGVAWIDNVECWVV